MQDPQTTQSDSMQELRRLKRLEDRRKRKLHIRIVLFVVAIIMVLSGILIFRSCSRKNAQQSGASRPSQQDPDASGIVIEPDTVIHIAAVGDITISDLMLEDAIQPNGNYDFTENFTAVSGYTVAADLTIGNLELNLCGEPYCGKPSYRAPQSLAISLAALGFDVVQTANSYSIQNGLVGLQSTIANLNTAGIDHVGTFATPEEKADNRGVLLKNVGGIKIAFIGYTKGLGGLSLPEGAEYAVNLLYKDYASDFNKLATDSILQDLEAAKAMQPDVIIVMLHWGSEADRTVSTAQKKLTTLLFENGADAIIGTHPHIIGPMEKRVVTTAEGKKKTCFVAYSLGNFFSSMSPSLASDCRESLILDLEFTKNGETGDCTMTDISYTPLYLMDQGEGAAPRYEILPVRNAINSGLFPDMTETLTDAIAHLRTNTDSDFDSGK